MLCLTSLLAEGKSRIFHTLDVKRLNGDLRFPLPDLAEHADAASAKQAATSLSRDDFIDAIFSLGGKESTVNLSGIAPAVFYGPPPIAMLRLTMILKPWSSSMRILITP